MLCIPIIIILHLCQMVSTDDHHQEVVGLCRERGYAGIVGNSGEYLAFQPPRYFSSSLLKLTYRVTPYFYSLIMFIYDQQALYKDFI